MKKPHSLFVSFRFVVQLVVLVAMLRSLNIRLFHVRLELSQSEYPRPTAPLGRSATCSVRLEQGSHRLHPLLGYLKR